MGLPLKQLVGLAAVVAVVGCEKSKSWTPTVNKSPMDDRRTVVISHPSEETYHAPANEFRKEVNVPAARLDLVLGRDRIRVIAWLAQDPKNQFGTHTILARLDDQTAEEVVTHTAGKENLLEFPDGDAFASKLSNAHVLRIEYNSILAGTKIVSVKLDGLRAQVNELCDKYPSDLGCAGGSAITKAILNGPASAR